MTKKKIVLIGGGGHCKACIDVIEQENQYQIKGIIDSDSSLEEVLGYPVLGGDELIPSLIDSDTWFLITVGQIKSYGVRLKVAKLLERHNAQLARIISPSAYVSKHARVGQGVVVMHKAIVNAAAQVGAHCIVNTYANLEHDVIVGDFCHISTGAILNGGVKIGSGCLVGSGTIVKNGISITNMTNVGIGGLIINDIVDSGTYVGFPPRKLNK